MMDPIVYHPIGVIHTEFKEAKQTPIQGSATEGTTGTIELNPEFEAGLKDLDGFSRLILIYHFHLSGEAHCLHVVPFLDDKERGVFATRAPVRPNAIGFSVVKLVAINGCALHIEDVDMIDGTPLLDIKPYVPEFDAKDAPRIGWLSKKLTNFYGARADERFVSK